MKIKTIRNRLDNADAFDKEVNAALSAGWRLIKREYINPLSQGGGHFTYIMLYAELVKDDPPKEAAPVLKAVTWQEAVRTLRDICKGQKDCNGCIVRKWCDPALGEDDVEDRKIPAYWEVPADE